MIINKELTNIRVPGRVGTWYVIDSLISGGTKYYLLEHEHYGDEVACVITTKDKVIMEEVYNGFDDLREEYGIV